MGLNDLMTEIKQDEASFKGDEAVENKVLKQVLDLVEDKISEVKNQAVKWRVSVLYGCVDTYTPIFQLGAADQDSSSTTDGNCGRQADRLLWRKGRRTTGHFSTGCAP
jgi:hypothetical protein